MRLLHNIGFRHNSNYNSREEIRACDEPLSFDGVYLNVYENQDVLIDKDVTLFVMGNHVGGDNIFDSGQRYELFCDWDQVQELVEKFQAKLGWHTWSHRDLTKLSDEEIICEITPPFPMQYFAYPYGNVNDHVARLVEDAGYKEAWSVVQGDGSLFQRKRSYLNW